MSNQLTRERIIDFLKSNEIAIVGFTRPTRDETLTKLIEAHKSKGQYIFFGDIAIEQRQNFEAVFPLCKTIIVIGIPYRSSNKATDSDVPVGDGLVSNMAWEYDYHRLVNEKLDLLVAFLKTLDPDIECIAQVDTGPLIDRHIAYQAGLGSYAKNQGLMHAKYGTEFYIGYLLCNFSFDREEGKDERLPLTSSRCEHCELCVKACPAKALSSNYEFFGQRCISYLTQKKDHLNWEERRLIGLYVYGCDMCQLVCPHNNNKIPSAYERASLNRLDLKTLIDMSNKEVVRTYKHTGFAWRGAKVLKRNAIIALGNKGNAEDAIFLEHFLERCSAYLAPYVLWSLYQCGHKNIKRHCEEILKKFEDEIIENECETILQLIK